MTRMIPPLAESRGTLCDIGSKRLCDISSLIGLCVHLLQIIVESQSVVKIHHSVGTDLADLLSGTVFVKNEVESCVK